MSDSNSSHAPVEVWQAIFDELDVEQDKRTLAACSLSCKTLLAPCYRRLYHNITLSTSASAQNFVRTIRSQADNQPATYVRGLSILCRDIPPSDLNSIIPALAHSLPTLSILRLDSLQWSQLDQPAKSALMTGFQTVQHVETSEVVFESEDQALEFITSFPSLTHLNRQSRDLGFSEQDPLPRPMALPTSLKTRHIEEGAGEDFILSESEIP